eukprot:4617072-Pleurochrysis_carterae.AAC.2
MFGICTYKAPTRAMPVFCVPTPARAPCQVLVTLEKLHWLGSEGEKWLRPEKRSPGRVCFYKVARMHLIPPPLSLGERVDVGAPTKSHFGCGSRSATSEL